MYLAKTSSLKKACREIMAGSGWGFDTCQMLQALCDVV